MSILIKDMEMPKNCRICPMLFDGHNYRWCNITGESLGIEETDNGRDEHCPLIEIPTPHGRLIDADKIDFRNYDMHDGKGNLIVDNNFVNGIVWANDCIDRTPTVIEAEGSET